MDPSLLSEWEQEKRGRIVINPCKICHHNEQHHHGLGVDESLWDTREGQSACLAEELVYDPYDGTPDIDMCRCRKFEYDPEW